MPDQVTMLNPASVFARTVEEIVPSLLDAALSPAFQHQATELPEGAEYVVSSGFETPGIVITLLPPPAHKAGAH